MTMGTFNFLVLIGMVLSFMGFLLFIYVYNLFPSQDWFGVINFTFGTQGFWVTIVLVPMLITVFDFFAESALAYWFPTSRSKLHDKYMLSVESGEVPDQSSPNPTPGKTTDPSDYDPSQRL